MIDEPWAPEAPGGGEAPRLMHHHVLEDHLSVVALVIDQKGKYVWSMISYGPYDMVSTKGFNIFEGKSILDIFYVA